MLSQRYVFSGLNLDAEPHGLQPGDYRFATNFRTYNAIRGALGEGQAVRGHLPLPLPAGLSLPGPEAAAAQVVGGCVDRGGSRVVYFLYHPDPARCGLYAWSYATGTATTLLTGPALGLDPAHRITAAIVAGGTLYWTDNYYEPRKLNLRRAADAPARTAALIAAEPEALNLLRRGPQFSLLASRETDPARAGQNFLPAAPLQFAYRYLYEDGETSVLSPWTGLLLAPVTREERAQNTIRLSIPAQERLSGLVARVELIVREGHSGVAGSATSLTRAQAVAPVYYYGNQAGAGLDPAQILKPFDYVPRRARALGLGDNRIFLGGNLEGFTRPEVQLSAGPVPAQPVAAVLSTVVRVFLDFCDAVENQDGSTSVVCQYAVPNTLYAVFTTPQGDTVYRPVQVISLPGKTGSYNASSLGVRYEDIFPPEQGQPGEAGYTRAYPVAEDGWTLSSPVGTTGAVRVFKSDSQYEVGLQFYDWAGRHPGVSGGAVLAIIPPLPASTATSSAAAELAWAVDNARAAAEIPTWAVSYQLVRTRNLRFTTFLQHVAADCLFGIGPNAAGDFGFSRYAQDGVSCVLLDLDNLTRAGLGYNFSPGDRVRLFVPRADGSGLDALDLEALGLYKGYLRLPVVALNGPPSTPLTMRYELYTPYRRGEQEPYYEVGPRYAVLDAGTSARRYATLSGRLDGDVYLIERPVALLQTSSQAPARTYLSGPPAQNVAEHYAPHDLAPTAPWHLDLGRATAFLRQMKEEDKSAALRFSNPFSQGSFANGHSAFEPLNEELFPHQDGAITALEPVRGNLLVLQEFNAQSAYLGKVQIADTQGKALISLSERVVGSHQPLAGAAGCQHPQTVQQSEDGYVYWWDCRQGLIIRYAGDGTTQVSKYGAAGYWRNRRRELLGAAEPRPSAWFDPLSGEYVCYPGAGVAGGAALAFCEPLNRWTTGYPGEYEFAVGIPGGVVSAFRGRLYRHDQDATRPGRTHGADYPVQVELPLTLGQAKAIKVWQTLALEGSAGWRAVVVSTSEGQRSRLEPFDFETLEGQHCAAFLRDELTPCDNPLEEGDELRATLLTIRLEHHTPVLPPVLAAPARLRALTVGATLSSPY